MVNLPQSYYNDKKVGRQFSISYILFQIMEYIISSIILDNSSVNFVSSFPYKQLTIYNFSGFIIEWGIFCND